MKKAQKEKEKAERAAEKEAAKAQREKEAAEKRAAADIVRFFFSDLCYQLVGGVHSWESDEKSIT